MARISTGAGEAQYNEANQRPAAAHLPEAHVNVGAAERLVSALAGAALLAYSMRHRKLALVLLPISAGLVARAVTGHSALYHAIGRDTATGPYASSLGSVHSGKGVRVERALTIQRPVSELYAFWRNFENLPRIMDHLESVITVSETRSHWIARGPAGVKIEWDAEVLNEEKDQRIAWRSLPGADVSHAGSVHFRPAPISGTEVRVVMSYEPPLGRLGVTVAKLLGENPARQLSRDLQHFKQLMESGEIPTTGPARREQDHKS